MINKITLSMFMCMFVLAGSGYAQNMKLIAKTNATYRNSGSYTEDSVHYFHSGNKTSAIGKYKIPEFEHMADSVYHLKYNNGKLDWHEKTICYYSGSDFDSSITYEINSSGNWDKAWRTSIKYSGGKPDTVLYEYWRTQGGGSWRASSRIIYTWSGNNILTRHRQTYNWNNSQNKYEWRENRMWTYTYSGGNETSYIDQKYSGGNWVDSFKRETMYAAGKVSEVNTFKSSGGNWNADTKNVYNRDGNSRLLYIKQDIHNGTTWEPNRIDTNIYLANNTTQFPDTSIAFAFLFGNINNIGKWYFSYLSKTDGRYTNLTSLSWDGTTAWRQTDNQDSIVYWYYGWNLDVNDVTKEENKVNVYPSPANNVINITLNNAMKDEKVHFAILDMQGRLMKNWMGAPKGVITMSIDELPAGNYILNVKGDSETTSKRFVVSK